ncbi:MAG: hypothetical protein ACOH2V_07240 [Candidatus Saccharimonadaceae bacterium]
MKQFSKLIKSVSLMVLSFLSTSIAFAQNDTTSLEVDTNFYDGGAFYTQVWFWVAVGLVFILLLIALLRGGNNKNKNNIIKE